MKHKVKKVVRKAKKTLSSRLMLAKLDGTMVGHRLMVGVSIHDPKEAALHRMQEKRAELFQFGTIAMPRKIKRVKMASGKKKRVVYHAPWVQVSLISNGVCLAKTSRITEEQARQRASSWARIYPKATIAWS